MMIWLLFEKYLKRPFLIDKLKFDLRIYVLFTSADPLKIFMYEDGLVRFCAVPYELPTNKNMKNTNQHLTNYAINKNHSDFEENDDSDNEGIGNKRSISWLWDYLEE